MSTTEVTESEAADTKELTDEINEIVQQVKKAILEVEKDAPPSGARVAIKEADLTLRAGVTKDVKGDLKFKLFGHDFGASGNLSRADTQTIEIKLTPSLKDAMAFGRDEGVPELLVKAIRSIRDSVAIAAAEEPRFDMTESSVELNIEKSKGGEVNFVLAGEGEKTNAQTVKLTLGPG